MQLYAVPVLHFPWRGFTEKLYLAWFVECQQKSYFFNVRLSSDSELTTSFKLFETKCALGNSL